MASSIFHCQLLDATNAEPTEPIDINPEHLTIISDDDLNGSWLGEIEENEII